MKQQVPRWTSSNAMVQKAYDEYFASLTDGFILCAHSQGGFFSLNSLLKCPENVKGVILVESSSTLDVEQVDVSCWKDVPFLFVYGDFLTKEYQIDGYVWAGNDAYVRTMRNLHNKILALGGDSTWMELPDYGIRGNTHALMIEDNARQIANMVCDWIKEHVK